MCWLMVYQQSDIVSLVSDITLAISEPQVDLTNAINLKTAVSSENIPCEFYSSLIE